MAQSRGGARRIGATDSAASPSICAVAAERKSTRSLTLFYGPTSHDHFGIGTELNADALTDYFFRQYFMQMSYSLLQASFV
jgi:hypothetical protein